MDLKLFECIRKKRKKQKASTPKYPTMIKGRKSDVGYDVSISEKVYIWGGQMSAVQLRETIHLKKNQGAVISLRSSTAVNYPGLDIIQPWIDPGFTGKPTAFIINHSGKNYTLREGDYIFSVVPVKTGKLKGKTIFKKKDKRGESKFGSTDKQNSLF